MKRITLITLATLLFTFSIQSQWIQISTVNSSELRSVKFLNVYTGLVGGINGIWKSTNSGINWESVLTGQTINSLFFLDNNIGYAAGDTGKIYKTTNSGTNWLQQPSSTGLNLHSINFYNLSAGYCVGQSGIILRTTNTGVSWYSNNNPLSQDLNSVLMMTNGNTAFAVGSNSTEIFTATGNGGTNWTYSLMIPNNSLYSLHNVPSATGNFIAVGGNGRIRRTTNNGGTWSLLTSGSTQTFKEIIFVTANIAYIVGTSGTILRTTNGGLNWQTQTSGTSTNLESISCIDSMTGWAVGNSGIVLRTGIPVGLQTNSYNMRFSLHQNYPNPFNPKTNIRYDLLESEHVQLRIFSVEGKLLKEIDFGIKSAGSYRCEIDLAEYSSGIYFYELVTASNIQRKKMVLIK